MSKLIKKYDTATGLEYLGKINSDELNEGLADANHVHYQTLASDVWEVHHGLYKKPSVNLFDEDMNSIVGVIKHTTNNDYEVYFKNAIKGYAISN